MPKQNRQSRFGFSLPSAFQRWSRKCRNPSSSLENYFFVCVSLIGNPAVLLTSALKHSKSRMPREVPHYFTSSKNVTRAIFYLVCTYILTYLGYNMWSHVVCGPSILVAFITPIELRAEHFHKLNCRVSATHSPGWVNFQLLLTKLNIRLYSHRPIKI